MSSHPADRDAIDADPDSEGDSPGTLGLTADVDVADPRWPDALEGDAEGFVKSWILAALTGAGRKGEVALRLTDDAELRSLNAAYRQKDAATNVLAFPTGPATAAHLGDIAIAYETMAREAAAQHKSLAAHTAHLTVHGVLHLAGYDHLNDDDAEKMEALERRILASRGLADPYASEGGGR